MKRKLIILMSVLLVFTACKTEPITREELISMIETGKNVSRVNTSEITDMSYLFYEEVEFNQDISRWDVSKVTNMEYMFYCTNFNHDISQWHVGNVTNMANIFSFSRFNQDISGWDVSNVTNMEGMFSHSAFNQDISDWDVSNVTDMRSMFYYSAFNQDISQWDVSNVTDMRLMFYDSAFNQDISSWDMSNVLNIYGMFHRQNPFSYDYDLSSWDLPKIVYTKTDLENLDRKILENVSLSDILTTAAWDLQIWSLPNRIPHTYYFLENNKIIEEVGLGEIVIGTYEIQGDVVKIYINNGSDIFEDGETLTMKFEKYYRDTSQCFLFSSEENKKLQGKATLEYSLGSLYKGKYN